MGKKTILAKTKMWLLQNSIIITKTCMCDLVTGCGVVGVWNNVILCGKMRASNNLAVQHGTVSSLPSSDTSHLAVFIPSRRG